MKAEKFTLVKHFDGVPKSSDFRLETEELAELADGEFLCQAEYLSVDPYMRVFTAALQPPVTMIGSQVARVIDSKSQQYPVDSYVVGNFGWRTLTTVKDDMATGVFGIRRLPDLGDLPRSYALGACGMPGNAAYFGFLELCQPKPGETVVVTGAAGAVGSLVGQIAKIKECRVIGFAGTDEKCRWIKSLGFDEAINYKTCTDIDAALKSAAPNGVDCYFDNVGGMLSHRIREQMNDFGRVSVCGFISGYNDKTAQESQVPVPERQLVLKQLRIEGFVVTRWDKEEEWQRGISQMTEWVREEKLKVHEALTEGFSKMPQAFIGMMAGENTGKAIIKV